MAESGTGVLLIEQFVTVALGLAHHAHIMEGGRIRFSGLARELREQPELLSSAYLLRGSTAGDPTAPLPGSPTIPSPAVPPGRSAAGREPNAPGNPPHPHLQTHPPQSRSDGT